MVADAGLAISQADLFFASIGSNILLALITYMPLRRRGDGSFTTAAPDSAIPTPVGPATEPEGSEGSGGWSRTGAVAVAPAEARTRAAETTETSTHIGVTWRQRVTLVGLVVGALAVHLQIGFLALAAGAVLVLIDRKTMHKAIEGTAGPRSCSSPA